jgi:uncharacterized RmlC-like cupin family protein
MERNRVMTRLLAAPVVVAIGLAAALAPVIAHNQLGDARTDQEARKPVPSMEKVVTVRPPAEVLKRQGLRQFVGISQATAGAKGLSMNLQVIPPGGAAKPHTHCGFETAIYVLKGRVEFRYGEGLRQSVINEPGDFVFLPPDVPHQPRNLSSTEPAVAIVARNDAKEQESVVDYDPDAMQRGRPPDAKRQAD